MTYNLVFAFFSFVDIYSNDKKITSLILICTNCCVSLQKEEKTSNRDKSNEKLILSWGN